MAFGAQRMVISVIDTNERAINFYTRLGYARLPERDWSPTRTGIATPDTSIRILVMHKELDLLSTL